MKRRDFIIQSGLLSTGSILLPNYLLSKPKGHENNRPAIHNRTFRSKSVEDLIQTIKPAIKDPELAWMFENCYPNTLDTTVDYEMINNRPDTFIITGDIDAMWLRDSTAQVWPYMPLIKKDEKLKNMVLGLVNRQTQCVLLDPYANAFYKDKNRESHWKSDRTQMLPGVHERKWEIDSLCYVIRLAHEYHHQTAETKLFDTDWDKAMRLIVKTFKAEQRKDGDSPYRFARKTETMTDSPLFNGTGRPAKANGLICSMFRPSDDATNLPYLIPSNIFAVLSLRQLAGIYQNSLNDTQFSKECSDLADEIDSAIKQFATAHHLDFGEIYAYEIDGFGNRIFMDDANVPSLMSLAYLGAHKPDDGIYQRTRAFLLSDSNPYFLKGSAAQGQGSPHTWKVHIWPMGIILRALTSTDENEIRQCIEWLKSTHAGTGFMHEAFHKDNPDQYTRSWFAWANTLFGELIIKVYHEFPTLLE
ncbi:MAG: glycoside hydrolase family 125 protein [Bacteroidales bacterium]|nr:glycoside hydrolase family 125 protein [Bacteroidales bacterium]